MKKKVPEYFSFVQNEQQCYSDGFIRCMPNISFFDFHRISRAAYA